MQKVILNDKGEVIGVEASNDDGVIRVKARKAVIFATGGFTHDVELRKNFLSIPAYGGCAAMTNEGDFIRISSTLGVQLRNMNYAWMCPISFEKAIAKDPSMIGCFSVAGDSMIFVDKIGKRVVNEKLHYNELAQKFFEWDGANAEFPYLILTSIWDQRAQDNSASHEYGRLIVPPGTDDRHVIKGATLEELAANIDARLQKYAGQNGGMRISPDFVPTSRRRIKRFNEFAKTGQGSGLPSRRARRRSALQRQREGGAGPQEPDHQHRIRIERDGRHKRVELFRWQLCRSVLGRCGGRLRLLCQQSRVARQNQQGAQNRYPVPQRLTWSLRFKSCHCHVRSPLPAHRSSKSCAAG